MRRFFLVVLLLTLMPSAFAAPLLDLRHPQVIKTQFPTQDLVLANVIATNAPYSVPSDGKSDCTTALQAAIDAVSQNGGGTVFLPVGRYRFDGSIVLKEGVTLRGDWRKPDASSKVAGTILMAFGGRGRNWNVAPFCLMQRGSGVREVSVWYPEQRASQIVAYPWSFKSDAGASGNNVTIQNVTLVNAYQGVKIGPDWNELHTLRHVYGTPLRCGIWMDFTTDIGRLIDIHFAPKYWLESGLGTLSSKADETNLRRFMRENGTGVEVGRSDWEYFFGVHLEGYARGVWFRAGEKGTTNAVLYDVSAIGGAVGLQIDELNEVGIAATHCRFGGRRCGVLGGEKFSTSAIFNDCTIGEGSQNAMEMRGEGRIGLQNCALHFWNEHAIAAHSGSITMLNCQLDSHLAESKPRVTVQLDAGVQRALILGNNLGHSIEIEMAPGLEKRADIQISDAPFDSPAPNPAPIVSPPDRRPLSSRLWNALDFGAKSIEAAHSTLDGAFDSTAAIQKALDAAGAAGGGTVYLPAGRFLCTGGLRVPSKVELRGSFDVPHHTISGGTTLFTTRGRGEENGAPFIQLAPNSGVRGLSIWYPAQNVENVVPYPWAVRALGPRCYALDVNCGNAYQGFDWGTFPSDGHLLRYVCGAPLRRGVWVSKGSGVVDSAQFNPHYFERRPANFPIAENAPGSSNGKVWIYQQNHLEAFIFGACPRTLQLNNFVFASLHGLHFVSDGAAKGAKTTSGRVINHGSDASAHGVTIDGGLDLELINTEVAAFGPQERAVLEFGDDFSGRARVFNTLGWAAPVPAAIIGGKGDVLLQGGNVSNGRLELKGGRERVQNWNFQKDLQPAAYFGVAVPSKGAASQTSLIGNTVGGAGAFAVDETMKVLSIGNSRALPPMLLKTVFASGFEAGQTPPDYVDSNMQAQNVDLNARFCRVQAGAGRDGSSALVIVGDKTTEAQALIYYRVFDVAIKVEPQTVLRYWIRPETKAGAHTGLDMVFSDGTPLRDSPARTRSGEGLHPGIDKGAVGQWMRVESPIGKWLAGKTIQTILFAFDSTGPKGNFKAAIDDIEIGSPAP